MSGVFVLAMLLAAPAPSADERRLSPAEVERVIDQAAHKRAAADKPPLRVIDGEVGVTVGTGGYREVFGTAVVVGDEGTAILSVERAETRRPARRRR